MTALLEQRARQVIGVALRKFGASVDSALVDVKVETVVPQIPNGGECDTIWNCQHVCISLRGEALQHAPLLTKALNVVANRGTRKADQGDDVWFHGTLRRLASIDSEKLAQAMMDIRDTPLRTDIAPVRLGVVVERAQVPSLVSSR